MTYLSASLQKALYDRNDFMIRYHLKEPSGAIAQGYLQACIEYAASQNNLPLLKLLFTMLCSDPEPMVAMQTWPLDAFKELIAFLEKNKKLLTIYSLSAYTINEYLNRYFVNYNNLRVLLTSDVGKDLLDKITKPKKEESQLFLKELDAPCMIETTSPDDCATIAQLTGRTCANPYCSECK